jgi:hypothetical protein
MADRVLLIDVDSTIPNLPLMKISSYHKAKGDTVGFSVAGPSIVYASVVFKKNAHLVDGYRFLYPDAEIIIGSGFDLTKTLPDEIEHQKPDYDLYPDMQYSMGFTTRGCIRHCYFCLVPKKEGPLVRWQHPKEFHDPRFNTICLLDNNWLADRPWFMKTSQWIIDHKLKMVEGGMDLRLVDGGIADRLKTLRFASPLHFAWDFEKDETEIIRGLKLLNDHGIDVRHRVFVYVYMADSSDEQYNSTVYRCRRLKEAGATPFVMYNIEKRRTRRSDALQRWTTRPWLFWSVNCPDIEDYARLRSTKKPKGVGDVGMTLNTLSSDKSHSAIDSDAGIVAADPVTHESTPRKRDYSSKCDKEAGT